MAGSWPRQALPSRDIIEVGRDVAREGRGEGGGQPVVVDGEEEGSTTGGGGEEGNKRAVMEKG